MAISTPQLTLQDYFAYNDDPDRHYELLDGELIPMPPESDANNAIAIYLLSQFLQQISFKLLRHKDTEIVVTSDRPRVRLPDLMILTEALWVALDGQRATITPEMPPPALVVEVVSPGKTNEDRDYRYKRSEYAARGIPEYWIVDPQPPKITLLTLVDGLYEETVFYRDQILNSSTLPGFNLSVNQVFQL